jgi:hypothetical protein
MCGRTIRCNVNGAEFYSSDNGKKLIIRVWFAKSKRIAAFRSTPFILKCHSDKHVNYNVDDVNVFELYNEAKILPRVLTKLDSSNFLMYNVDVDFPIHKHFRFVTNIKQNQER